MISPKTAKVRHYIFGQLESGKLKAGDKLIGAREIALELGISFLKVQQAIETLVQDGILETIPRSGTLVLDGWKERVVADNLSVYEKSHRLPWLEGVKEIISEEIPELRVTDVFPKSMLEIKTTLSVQANKDDYIDLSDLFDELYPDKSLFFDKPMSHFYLDGKLFGIPMVFSPRVVYYNPEVLSKAGCDLPQSGWTWDNFIDTVKKLKQSLPNDKVVNWDPQAFMWMNFIKRAGGDIFSQDPENPIVVDSPKSLYGIKLFAELGKLIGRDSYSDDNFRQSFVRGEAALMIGGRQILGSIEKSGFKEWSTVNLPSIPGGKDITSQATDLICIRKSCTSLKLAKSYIELMLSERVQDYLAETRYGIPFRKSSAFKSIDSADDRDSIFLDEMNKTTASNYLLSPYLSKLIFSGVEQALQREDDIEKEVGRIAGAARVCYGIMGNK